MGNLIDFKPSQQCEQTWRPHILKSLSTYHRAYVSHIDRYQVIKRSAPEIAKLLKDSSEDIYHQRCYYLCGRTGRIFIYTEEDPRNLYGLIEPVEITHTHDEQSSCNFRSACLHIDCPFCLTTPESFCYFWNIMNLGSTLHVSDLPEDFGERPLPLNELLDFNKVWADATTCDGSAIGGGKG